MGARELLAELQSDGLTIQLIDKRLIVSPSSRLTDSRRDCIRAAKGELVKLLSLVDAPRIVNARRFALSKTEGDDAHAVAWNDDAITRFLLREGQAQELGLNADDSSDVAERLHLRDVEALDMHSCLECSHRLGQRCSTGVLHGIPRDEATRLRRCRGFSP